MKFFWFGNYVLLQKGVVLNTSVGISSKIVRKYYSKYYSKVRK